LALIAWERQESDRSNPISNIIEFWKAICRDKRERGGKEDLGVMLVAARKEMRKRRSI
jgi:hypothetical protein